MVKNTGYNFNRMAGWCKGAGMIHPNMATMLGGIFTDAKLSQEALNKSTKYTADKSFNAVSVDGDTSTNDTFAVFANGASQMKDEINVGSTLFKEFQDNLTLFATELAQLIVRDGEGATKMIEVKVKVSILIGSLNSSRRKNCCKFSSNFIIS